MKREVVFYKLRDGINKIYEENISDFENRFQQLQVSYLALLKSKEEQNAIESLDFSIFNILGYSKEEIHLHSPILLEFLNVNGTHGQGDLFYKNFIKTIIEEENQYNFIGDSNFLEIRKEVAIKTPKHKGFIDILIQSKDEKNPFVIILENKWKSGDSSEDQMLKYYEYYKLNGYKDEEILMIYLTQGGKNPSISSTKYNRVVNSDFFKAISYKKDIKKWLNTCISDCKSEKVKYIIEQYINYLEWEI